MTRRDINHITSLYGIGKITIPLLIGLSLTIIVDGIEMTFMGLFLIPLTKYYSLSSIDIQAISSILFVGVAIGNYISPYLAHKFTRKVAMNYTYIAWVLAHIVMSCAYFTAVFAIARFVIGVGIGIILPFSLNIMSEYLPPNRRGFYLTAIWVFFSIGMGIQGCLMLIIMPNLDDDMMNYVIFALGLVVLFSERINNIYFIESPTGLLTDGDSNKAYEILNEMLKSVKEPELSNDEKDLIKKDLFVKEGNDNQVSIEELFKENVYRTTVTTIFIEVILSFLFYGVLLISTLTMQAINKKKEVVGEVNPGNNRQIIIDQIIVAFASSPGNFIGGMLCEIKQIGRRKTMMIGFAIAAVSSFLIILFIQNFTILYCIYLSFVNMSFNVTLTYIVEIYPSRLKNTSSGFLFSCLRVSGFLSQYIYLYLSDIHYTIPYYFCCIIATCAIALSCNLPYDNSEDLAKKYVEIKKVEIDI